VTASLLGQDGGRAAAQTGYAGSLAARSWPARREASGWAGVRLLGCADRGVIGCVPRAGLRFGRVRRAGRRSSRQPAGRVRGRGRAVTGGVAGLLEALRG